MSEGVTAVKDAPVNTHRDGWGMLWQDPTSKQLHCYRSDQPIANSIENSPYKKINTPFLAIHLRRATLAKNLGIDYAHPVAGINQTNAADNRMLRR